MNSFCAPELNLQNDKRIAESNSFITVQMEKSYALSTGDRMDKKERNKKE